MLFKQGSLRRSLRNLLGFSPAIRRQPIYTPGWREALWELSVLLKNTTVSPARARTRTARSGDERTNHEATTPPQTGSTAAFIHSLYDSTLNFPTSRIGFERSGADKLAHE